MPDKATTKKSPKKLYLIIGLVIVSIMCVRMWKDDSWLYILNKSHDRIQHPSIILDKEHWVEVDTTGMNFREVSIHPPVRRIVMVNNDINRSHSLSAEINNSLNVGKDVKSLKWKIAPDEPLLNAELEYELSR